MEGPPWARAAPGPRRLLSSAAKLRKGRRLRTSLRLGSWIHRARLTPPLSSLILYSDLNLNPGFNTGSFRSVGRGQWMGLIPERLLGSHMFLLTEFTGL